MLKLAELVIWLENHDRLADELVGKSLAHSDKILQRLCVSASACDGQVFDFLIRVALCSRVFQPESEILVDKSLSSSGSKINLWLVEAGHSLVCDLDLSSSGRDVMVGPSDDLLQNIPPAIVDGN